MSLVETILVDGTDLANYGRLITDWGSVFDAAPRRGSNYVLPGADGATYVAKPLDVLAFPVGVILTGKDPSTGVLAATDQLQAAQVAANWVALKTLTKVETGGTVTLTRKLSTLAGSYTTETCTAECSGGIQASPLSHGVIRVVIGFVNLSGKWT